MLKKTALLSLAIALTCGSVAARADLLGVELVLFPMVHASGSGWADYAPPGGPGVPGELTLNVRPSSIDWSSTGAYRSSSFSRSSNLRIALNIDEQGEFVGGPTGPDLLLTGEVAERDPSTGAVIKTYQGDLLAGEVLEAGFRFDIGIDALMVDLRVRIDGGELKSRFGPYILGVTAVITTGNFEGFRSGFDGLPEATLGPVCGGRIGDRVWNDNDRDGIQTEGEAGIPGILVTLTNLGTGQSSTKTTDANGAYVFNGLCAGSYRVAVGTLPGGFEPSPQCGAADPTCTPESDSDRSPATTALSSDTDEDLSKDFGFFQRFGGLSGRVWHDLDGDGVQDSGEPGLGSIKVTATGPNGSKNATTGPNGSFSFSSLLAGTYDVCAEAPAGFRPTYDHDGIGTQNCASVEVDESVSGVDFGYQEYASIGDRVWEDTNANGRLDGESGLAGWTVRLAGGPSANRSMKTGADGAFRFDEVLPGTYDVCVVKVAGFVQTYDLDGTSTRDCAKVVVGAGQKRADVDFGYQKGARIGNKVWADTDGDGKVDATEVGLAGVQVQLLGPAYRKKNTNANGNYSFGNLVAGTYRVCVAQPVGYKPTFDRDGAGVTPNCTTVTVNGGQTRNDIDFGYGKLVGLAGRIWEDMDRDGVMDPLEPAAPSDKVTLTLPDGSTLSTIPDENGVFSFPSQGPGTYVVTVSRPSGSVGYRPTFDPDGIATPDTATVVVTDTELTNLNFGYRQNSTPEGDVRD